MRSFNRPSPPTPLPDGEGAKPFLHLMSDCCIELSLPEASQNGSNRLTVTKLEEYPWPNETGIRDAHRKGITGGGVIVGVLDTGCDAGHNEFNSKRVDFRYVPVNKKLNPLRRVMAFDPLGHGTHVCGILAGQNIGIAPDVDLLVASVIESETLKTSLERVVIGLEWFLSELTKPDNINKPAIINMSLGFPVGALDDDDRVVATSGIRNILRTLYLGFDVLPIVAVGNDGPGQIRMPAHFDEAFSVGAVDFSKAPATFSGGGQSVEGGQIKPDVVGYGVSVLSSLERDPDNRSWYGRMSGTSMATPYVSGVASLIASSDNSLQGERLRQRLVDTALSLGTLPQSRIGVGLARFV